MKRLGLRSSRGPNIMFWSTSMRRHKRNYMRRRITIFRSSKTMLSWSMFSSWRRGRRMRRMRRWGRTIWRWEIWSDRSLERYNRRFQRPKIIMRLMQRSSLRSSGIKIGPITRIWASSGTSITNFKLFTSVRWRRWKKSSRKMKKGWKVRL